MTLLLYPIYDKAFEKGKARNRALTVFCIYAFVDLYSNCAYVFHFFLCRHARSQSCPFCRDSLKRVKSRDVWVYTEICEVQDTQTLTKDSLRRLFMYIDKLPLLVSQSVLAVYDSHLKQLCWDVIYWQQSPSTICKSLGSQSRSGINVYTSD